jgi:hypothetical protein
MSHQEIKETFHRMGAITRRFLAAVNYRSNPTLPLFPRYPQSSSSSASTGRSHPALSSTSRPPYQVAFYLVHPPAHPPLRMSQLGGPSLRGSAPTRAPAPARQGLTPQGPALGPAPVLAAAAPIPSSSLGAILPSRNDHYSMWNHIKTLYCIN